MLLLIYAQFLRVISVGTFPSITVSRLFERGISFATSAGSIFPGVFLGAHPSARAGDHRRRRGKRIGWAQGAARSVTVKPHPLIVDKIVPAADLNDSRMAQFLGNLRVAHLENPLDRQIAATALIHDLIVLIRNVLHFGSTRVRLLHPFE